MAYRIKAKIINGADYSHYFMGFTKKGKLPQWTAEFSSLPKREWASKSSATRVVNQIKATHMFPMSDIVIEEV